MSVFCLAICCRLCTWVNIAVWFMKSLALAGLSGSWYFIWATSSFRKVSLPNWSGRSTELEAVVAVAAGEPLMAGVVMGVVLSDQQVHAGRRVRALGRWGRAVG